MGNIFWKKREITAELENLTHQMKAYKTDIDKTFESKRMLLWYMTMVSFFVTTSLIAYVWMNFTDRQIQILLSIGSFIAGLVLLWISRRLVNAFFDWRLNKKKKALDELIEKKKTILETVKETETFKKAKEILEKYDDQPPPLVQRPASQPATPVMNRKPGPPPPPPPGTPMMQPNRPIPAGPMSPPKQLQSNPARSLQNIPMNAQLPPRPLMPQRPPVRPFHQEPTSAVYKMVDYFFSDGPSNRMALICSNCHGHNGMALPHEYEYLAFECFLCRHFNPAKKFRQTAPLPGSRPEVKAAIALPPQDPIVKQADPVVEEPAEEKDDAKDAKEGTEEEFDVVPSDRGTDDDDHEEH